MINVSLISLATRRLARAAVGARANCPVVVVSGDAEPMLKGERYYWTWGKDPKGRRVRSNKGRSMWRTHYWPSTIRVEISVGWLVAQQAEAATEARTAA